MPSLKFLIKNIPAEITHEICRNFNKKFHFRPSSDPFLAGDTYRSIVDILFDETYLCTSDEINNWQSSTRKVPLVFLSSWLISDFICNILPTIDRPFAIITHQGDVNIDNSEKYSALINNKNLIHWFAQNCTLSHPKVTPLPIGLEDRWQHDAGAIRDFVQYQKKTHSILNSSNSNSKMTKVLLGFSLGTNPDSRFKCYRAFWRKDILKEIYTSPNAHNYRKLLEKYKFVASPAGNGLDCHRTWEAMYLGVVPLVEDNYMNQYFASLGLPLYCVSDWNEVANLSEQQLAELYNQVISTSSTQALYFDYWKNKIFDKLTRVE